jgi:hypothetical protein
MTANGPIPYAICAAPSFRSPTVLFLRHFLHSEVRAIELAPEPHVTIARARQSPCTRPAAASRSRTSFYFHRNSLHCPLAIASTPAMICVIARPQPFHSRRPAVVRCQGPTVRQALPTCIPVPEASLSRQSVRRASRIFRKWRPRLPAPCSAPRAQPLCSPADPADPADPYTVTLLQDECRSANRISWTCCDGSGAHLPGSLASQLPWTWPRRARVLQVPTPVTCRTWP